METVNTLEKAQPTKQTRRKLANTRYRQTSKGWLYNYYSRLKSRANEVTMYTSEQFTKAAQESNSFRASWQAYVESGFDKAYAPKLLSFEMGKEANELPALFYA